MNYSTLKKTVALSFASIMAVGMVKAQTSTTAVKDTLKTSSETTTPKVFGGAGQYNTWSFGVNAGLTSGSLFTGGAATDVNGKAQVALGYGVSLRKQLAHSFGLQLDVHGGNIKGKNDPAVASYISRANVADFKTKFYNVSLTGVLNVVSVDWLHRKDNVHFFVLAGYAYNWYQPVVTYATAASNASGRFNPSTKGKYGTDGTHTYVKEVSIPVGVGVKFRLSDAVALNFGYTENFTDGDNLDGINRVVYHKDKYSYGYGGLEFTLGSKSKPSLEWANPVALLYDELYDAALRQEVAALKSRVANVENSVNDLKKDSDGDGVSDQFDKCPNTPAGTVVDGSGCEIKFPAATIAPSVAPSAVAYSNIAFDFDSSVLRTSSYPVLDATSADLRTSGASIEVDGFASSEGTAAHNMRLSKDRAASVKTYLVNSGVDAKKVKVKGFGETKPIADNSTEEGRIANRRVEFKK